MKPFTDTLLRKMLDHNPRVTTGDQDLLDAPDEEHIADVMSSLYQVPKWEALDAAKQLYRRARHAPPTEHAIEQQMIR